MIYPFCSRQVGHPCPHPSKFTGVPTRNELSDSGGPPWIKSCPFTHMHPCKHLTAHLSSFCHYFQEVKIITSKLVWKQQFINNFLRIFLFFPFFYYIVMMLYWCQGQRGMSHWWDLIWLFHSCGCCDYVLHCCCLEFLFEIWYRTWLMECNNRQLHCKLHLTIVWCALGDKTRPGMALA